MEESSFQFAGSRSITSEHTKTIIEQDMMMATMNHEGITQKEALKKHLAQKEESILEKIKEFKNTLPKDLLQFVQGARDKGAGSWLTSLPLCKQGCNLRGSSGTD